VSKRDPLNPTTLDITLTLDGNAQPLVLPQFSNPKGLYGGRPLFLHAQSNKQTLSILIDDVDVQGGAQPLLDATSVDVTFVLNKKLVNHWQPVQLPYRGKRGLTFKVTIDPTFTNLHFFIDDAPHPPSNTKNDGQVSFVLVRQMTGDFEFHWITDEIIVVPDARDLQDGSVVLPPDPGARTGGIPGPMGFTAP